MTQKINKALIFSLTVLTCHMNAGAVFATVDEVSLGASSVWSNWYWPSKDSLNPNMYDNGESMAKYDDYEIPNGESAQDWEAAPENHGDFDGVEDWHGHCHAWAAAAVWEPQPTFSEIHSGVEFRIRDKKALLTEIYTKALYDHGIERNVQFSIENPSPGTLWKILRKEIRGILPTGGVAKPVIMDLSPTSGAMWNYPIFRYKVEYNGTSPNISGNMWFYKALDGEPEYADDTTTHWEVTQAYAFSGVSMNGTEPVDSSGTWNSTILPPKLVWRSKSNEEACTDTGENSMTCMSENPHLDSEYLRVIVDTCSGSAVYVDKSATENGTGTLVRPFKTVTEGASEVCNKGQLYVTAGTYTEKLQIKNKLTLKNAGGAVIIKTQ